MRTSMRALILSVTVPAAGLVVWWYASADTESVYFPSLKTILSTTWTVWSSDRFAGDLLPSVGRMTAGLALAIVIGVSVGVLLGRSTRLFEVSRPIIEFVRALPPPLLIPFGMSLLGTGSTMKILIIAIGSFAPILLNSVDGARGVPSLLTDVSRVYGFSRWRTFRSVVLPSASPQIFAGIRVGLAVSVILMVISEMLASTNGLGYFIVQAQRSFSIPEMWSGIVVLGFLGFSLSMIFDVIERSVLGWHFGSKAMAVDAGGDR